MKKFIITSLLIGSLNSTLLASENSIYLGAAGNLVSTAKSDSINLFEQQGGQDRALGATLILGYSIRDFLDIEARYMRSIAKEDDYTQTTWNLFFKPKYEVFDNLSLYALYGIGGVNISPKNSNEDFSLTDISYGAGIKYDLTSSVSIFTDYVDNARHNIENFKGSEKSVATKTITTGLQYSF